MIFICAWNICSVKDIYNLRKFIDEQTGKNSSHNSSRPSSFDGVRRPILPQSHLSLSFSLFFLPCSLLLHPTSIYIIQVYIYLFMCVFSIFFFLLFRLDDLEVSRTTRKYCAQRHLIINFLSITFQKKKKYIYIYIKFQELKRA